MGGGPSMGAGLDPQASSQCFTRDQKSRRQVSIRFGSKQKNEALILSTGKKGARGRCDFGRVSRTVLAISQLSASKLIV
jgi:hypothetical protein